jgi:GLUG motif-containing protein
MGKISKSAVPAFILTVLWLFALPAQAKYNGGSGTAADPYQINDPCQLNSIGVNPDDWDKHFILTANIDMAGYSYTRAIIAPDTSSIGGFQGTVFTGTFDGAGFVINNLTIDDAEAGNDFLGLFGIIEGSNAEVKNIGLENVNVTGDYYLGSLVGKNDSGNLSNCYATGSVSGGDNSYCLGGLCGENYGSISNCYATGSVSGNYCVGGLVGFNYSGNISNCYATGIVSGNDRIGGLVGYNIGSISDCYATGRVNGDDYLGGLVGENKYEGNISNCYATGRVSGDDYLGGLVGRNGSFVHGSYWDIETSGLNVSEGGKGKTTPQMQSATTYIGWGCGDWTINEGNDYPRLDWQNIPGKPIVNSDPALLYGGGEGTPGDPYLIYTAEQLNNIGLYSCHWNYHFRLMADIDLSGFTGTDFNIIGYPFTGTFDGAGHTIFHFTYSTTDKQNGIGLFGYINKPSALIQDLTLSDPYITTSSSRFVGSLVGRMGNGAITGCSTENGTISGDYYIGGLVGQNSGSISNCYATGSVSGDDYLGGLVGYNRYGSISNCYVTGSVNGTKNFVGGLVGTNIGSVSNCYSTGNISGNFYVGGLVGWNSGIVSNCYSTGFVSSNRYVGGLVGQNRKGIVSNCYSTGDTSGNINVGGLVGSNDLGHVSNCYSTGAVRGGSDVGGLVGDNWYGSVSNCYSTGAVSGGSNVGGLVGEKYRGRVRKSFWDIETSGMTISDGGTGKTTTEMYDINTYLNAGWDFVDETANGTLDTWYIVDGWYPNFVWNAGCYAGGSGTVYDPYQIATVGHLCELRTRPDDWSKHFILTADIDMSGRTYISAVIASDTDNMAMGFQGTAFTGTFDGNGYEIVNMAIDTAGAGNDYLGLFGMIADPNTVIKNLGMENCSIIGGNDSLYLGCLVGGNNKGRLSNCYASGSVNGGDNSECLGGLVGENNKGRLSNCYATGSVNSGDNSECLGGLVGENNKGRLSNCYATGSVNGRDNSECLGGLVGENNKGRISNCYAIGSISNGDNSDYLGGLVGYNYHGKIFNCFWDVETSGMATSDGGTGKTTDEMQTQSTFTNAGWDFVGDTVNGTEDIWDICEGTNYPKLIWQFLVGDFVCSDGVDLADFAVLAETWGLSSGQVGYNDLCDMVDDDMIDLADLAVFAENWLTGK